MNDKELIAKVNSAMYHQCRIRGYAAPVDVMMDIGVLSKQKYEDWRFGRAAFLEGVCTVNLRKLSLVMHQMRSYAVKENLKASVCCYKRWGKHKTMSLRFSKSGNPDIEKWYATHFVDTVKTAQLKMEKEKENSVSEQ